MIELFAGVRAGPSDLKFAVGTNRSRQLLYCLLSISIAVAVPDPFDRPRNRRFRLHVRERFCSDRRLTCLLSKT